MNNLYDNLIRKYSNIYGLDWLLIKAQIKQESAFNPKIVSPVGAMGLMQLMPATAKELGCVLPFNPEENIKAGTKYMKFIFDRFPEIPNELERYKFSLASYNCGRGNINKTLNIAREKLNIFVGYNELMQNLDSFSGDWQNWIFSSQFLCDVIPGSCSEPLMYVIKIMQYYREYKRKGDNYV